MSLEENLPNAITDKKLNVIVGDKKLELSKKMFESLKWDEPLMEFVFSNFKCSGCNCLHSFRY